MMPVRIPKNVTDDLVRAFRKSKSVSKRIVREGTPELIRSKLREESDQKKTSGLLCSENRQYVEPDLEKKAFLARALSVPAAVGVGIGNVARSLNPKSPMTLKKAIPTAKRYYQHIEPRLREALSRTVGARSAQLADKPMRGVDQVVNAVTGKNVPVGIRKRVMQEAAEHPISILGAPAGMAVPVPGASEVGMAGAWTVSKAGKKLLGIPASSAPAMSALDDIYRQKGYKDVADFLSKTKASPMTTSERVRGMTEAIEGIGGKIPGQTFI
jgi:hypothetical protein